MVRVDTGPSSHRSLENSTMHPSILSFVLMDLEGLGAKSLNPKLADP